MTFEPHKIVLGIQGDNSGPEIAADIQKLISKIEQLAKSSGNLEAGLRKGLAEVPAIIKGALQQLTSGYNDQAIIDAGSRIGAKFSSALAASLKTARINPAQFVRELEQSIQTEMQRTLNSGEFANRAKQIADRATADRFVRTNAVDPRYSRWYDRQEKGFASGATMAAFTAATEQQALKNEISTFRNSIGELKKLFSSIIPEIGRLDQALGQEIDIRKRRLAELRELGQLERQILRRGSPINNELRGIQAEYDANSMAGRSYAAMLARGNQAGLNEEQVRRIMATAAVAGRPADPRILGMAGLRGEGNALLNPQAIAMGTRNLDQYNNALARTAVSMSILYGIQAGVRSSANQYFQLENVQSRINIASSNVGQARTLGMMPYDPRLLAISQQTGVPGQQLAMTGENIMQSGDVPLGAYYGTLGTSARVSRVTGADPSKVSNILTAGRNAFRLDDKEMLEFADELVKTYQEGVITLDEMDTSLGKVFQTAKLAGFEGSKGLKQVLAMVTAVTKEAGTAAQNTTALARVFSDISKPRTIERLRSVGINYNREDPLETIQAIASRGPEFIQGSGLFPNELSRRGLSVLSSQMDLVDDRISRITTDLTYLDSSFDSVMDRSGARVERLARSFDNLRTVVTSDFARTLDTIVRPLLAIGDMQAGGNVHPAVGIAGGVGRGFLEGAASFLTTGLALRAGGTLLGLGGMGTVLGAPKAGFGSYFGTASTNFAASGLEMLYAGMGMQGHAGKLKEQIAAQNQAMLQGQTLSQSYKTAGTGPLQFARFAGPGIATAMLAQLAASAGYNAYAQSNQTKAMGLQGELDLTRTGLNYLREDSDSIFGTLSEPPGPETQRAALEQFKRVMESYPEFASRNEIYVDAAANTIEINGRLATSFKDVRAAIAGALNVLSAEEFDAYAQQALTTFDQQSNLQRLNMKAGNATNLMSLMGKGYEIGAMGLVNPLINLIPGVKDFFGTMSGSKQEEEFEKLVLTQRKQLEDDLKRQDEAREARARNQKQINSSEEEEVAQVYKTLAALRDKLASQEATATLTGQIEGLTESELDEKKTSLSRQTLYSSYLELLAQDANTASDIMSMVARDAPDLYESMVGAAQALADTALKSREVALTLARMQDVAARQVGYIDQRLGEGNRAAGAFGEYQQGYLGAMSGLTQPFLLGIPDKARPIGQLLLQNKTNELEFAAGLQGLQLTADAERLNRAGLKSKIGQAGQGFDIQAAQLKEKTKFAGMLAPEATLEMLKSGTEEEKAIARELLRTLYGADASGLIASSDAITDATYAYNQPSTRLSQQLSGLSGTLMKGLQVPFALSDYLKGTTFDADKDAAAITAAQTLLGSDLGKIGFAENFTGMMGQVGNAITKSGFTIEELKKTSGPTAAWADFYDYLTSNNIDVAKVIKDQDVPTLAKIMGGLNNVSQATLFGDSGKTFTELVSSITDSWETMDDITPEMVDTYAELRDKLKLLTGEVERAQAFFSALQNNATASDIVMAAQEEVARQYQVGVPTIDLSSGAISPSDVDSWSNILPDMQALNSRKTTAIQGLSGWDNAWESVLTDPASAESFTNNLVFASPFKGGNKQTSPYGMRNGKMHTGWDGVPKDGDGRIFPGRPGQVIFTGEKGGYGNTVMVRHGYVGDQPIDSLYGHLSSIKVKEGDIVGMDDVLGKYGNTGNSRGKHLHFEVRVGGKPIEVGPDGSMQINAKIFSDNTERIFELLSSVAEKLNTVTNMIIGPMPEGDGAPAISVPGETGSSSAGGGPRSSGKPASRLVSAAVSGSGRVTGRTTSARKSLKMLRNVSS